MANTGRYRVDPLTGDQVYYQPARSNRPNAASAQDTFVTDPEKCPFCPHATKEQQLGAICDEDGNWLVRSLPNLYPAVSLDAPDAVLFAPENFRDQEPAVGHQEVAVVTRDHSRHWADFTDDEAVLALTFLQERARRAMTVTTPFPGVSINHLKAAHASISHAHAHVFATPYRTTPPKRELDHLKSRKEIIAGVAKGIGSGVRTVIELERDFELSHSDDPRNLVLQTGEVTAWMPFASAHTNEVRITPNDIDPLFTHAPKSTIRETALAIRNAIAAFAQHEFGINAYNVAIHSGGLRGRADEPEQWHVHLYPGGEPILTTGLIVNEALPEVSAPIVRDTIQRLGLSTR